MRYQPRNPMARSLIAAVAACAALLVGLVVPVAAFGDLFITFDDRPRPGTALVGEYPVAGANWGLNGWWHASPTGPLNRSVSFNGQKYPNLTQGTISLAGQYRLVSLDIYNGGAQATDV